MSKYYDLVGSFYNNFTKKYEKEEIIKIPGVTFNSIEDIDKFTASMNRFTFASNLDEKYNNKNTFSIRVTDNKDNCYYQSVIFDEPLLVEIINSLNKRTVYLSDGYRTINMIGANNTLFNTAWKTVRSKITSSNEEDKEWLFSIYTKNSRYGKILYKYMTGDSFDANHDDILLELEKLFRDYEVFRKYFVNKDRDLIKNLCVSSDTIPLDTSITSLERKCVGSTYESKKDYLDDYDKEEFFDEEEIKMMSDGEDNVPYHFTGRKI